MSKVINFYGIEDSPEGHLYIGTVDADNLEATAIRLDPTSPLFRHVCKNVRDMSDLFMAEGVKCALEKIQDAESKAN